MKLIKKAMAVFAAAIMLVTAFGPVVETQAAVGGAIVTEKDYQKQLKKVEKYGFTANSTSYSKRLAIINKALVDSSLDYVIANSQVKVDKKSFDLMCRVVQAEAGYVSYSTRELIAEVIVHRCQTAGFPNNVNGVLVAPHQFSVVSNGAINKVRVDGITINAVKDALLECQHPRKVLYFRAGHYFSGLQHYKAADGTYFSYGRY